MFDLLMETGMLGSKACDTPMEQNQKLGDGSSGELSGHGELSETCW